MPALVLSQFDGISGPGGSVVTSPFWNQQLSSWAGASSHQKSTPFGRLEPSGAIPITLLWYRLRCETEFAVVASSSENESGTLISIVPRRQLSQMRFPRTSLPLPPAIRMPTPTGTGTFGSTSELGTKLLKLFE